MKRLKNQECRVGDGKRTRIQVDTPTAEEQLAAAEEEDECIPTTPSMPNANNNKARVTFVLDQAPLKLGFVKKTMKILNAEEHSSFLLKQKKNPDDFRPDILHRALLAIIDSPLYKSGLVHAIYVKVDNGVLFEVKPHTRIPRMYKRFYGVMLELLQKSCVTAGDKQEKLLHVIPEPVTRHLPTDSRIIGLSCGSQKLVNLKDYVAATSNDVNLVFVIGLMTPGKIDKKYLDDFISVSRNPLSPSSIIGARICDTLEEMWKII